jgi:hypothetical protein
MQFDNPGDSLSPVRLPLLLIFHNKMLAMSATIIAFSVFQWNDQLLNIWTASPFSTISLNSANLIQFQFSDVVFFTVC